MTTYVIEARDKIASLRIDPLGVLFATQVRQGGLSGDHLQNVEGNGHKGVQKQIALQAVIGRQLGNTYRNARFDAQFSSMIAC